MTETTNTPLRIVAIAGSLRRGSWNRRLLEAARDLAPAGMRIDIVDLADVPLYDGDHDTNETRPAAVRRLKQLVAEADGVLTATPEYNHSVPGVLQNAIDWVSRPAMQSPLVEKPAAIIGVSRRPRRRARSSAELVLMATLAQVLPHPGVRSAWWRRSSTPREPGARADAAVRGGGFGGVRDVDPARRAPRGGRAERARHLTRAAGLTLTVGRILSIVEHRSSAGESHETHARDVQN